ncbi:MAG: C39 family peptidase [Polyangiaceae bacterium]
MPLAKGREVIGYADIAASGAFGDVVLAVSLGAAWDEPSLRKAASSEAKRRLKGQRFDDARFVVFSFPKVAVQFLAEGRELLMLELHTWRPVPPARRGAASKKPPGNFQRWSLLDSLSTATKGRRTERVLDRLSQWDKRAPAATGRYNPALLGVTAFRRALGVSRRPPIADTRVLHYTTINADHSVCYELRGQLTNVWCVAASVEMVLDFYRYRYPQTRVATELGLGTIASPSGLPYSHDSWVVDTLQKLSNKSLTATLNNAPTWAQFRSEIRANRPLVSFIPGHSRTVAGYVSSTVFPWHTFRGLLVYDPWPPTTGVITRWENFDTQSYRVTFTAQVTTV